MKDYILTGAGEAIGLIRENGVVSHDELWRFLGRHRGERLEITIPIGVVIGAIDPGDQFTYVPGMGVFRPGGKWHVVPNAAEAVLEAVAIGAWMMKIHAERAEKIDQDRKRALAEVADLRATVAKFKGICFQAARQIAATRRSFPSRKLARIRRNLEFIRLAY